MVTANYNSYKDSVIDRDAVIRAFKVLRKDKILARANHWCCQSCGGADLEGRMETEERAFGDSYGYNPTLNIYYTGTKDLIDTLTHSDDGLTSEEIGYGIYYALKAEGLNVLWDGNEHNSIAVFPDVFNEEEETSLYGTFSHLNPDSPLIPEHLRETVRESRNAWLVRKEQFDREYEERKREEESLAKEKEKELYEDTYKEFLT